MILSEKEERRHLCVRFLIFLRTLSTRKLRNLWWEVLSSVEEKIDFIEGKVPYRKILAALYLHEIRWENGCGAEWWQVAMTSILFLSNSYVSHLLNYQQYLLMDSLWDYNHRLVASWGGSSWSRWYELLHLPTPENHTFSVKLVWASWSSARGTSWIEYFHKCVVEPIKRQIMEGKRAAIIYLILDVHVNLCFPLFTWFCIHFFQYLIGK